MKKNKFLYIVLGVLVIGFSSCQEDFLDTEFTDGVDKETATELAETDPEALNAYLRGIFVHMVSYDITGNEAHDDFSFMSVLHSTDMQGESMVQASSHWFNFDYQHDNWAFNYRRTAVNWQTFYTIIAKSNEIIDFFPEEPEEADSKGILGQAYALRGMAYYYLIQLYQKSDVNDPEVLNLPGVPLRYSNIEIEENGWTEEDVDELAGRNTVADVYDQIESDLQYSIELLEDGYSRPSKIFVNANVAKGFMARYSLLAGEWEQAATYASEARVNDEISIMDRASLHDGFMDIENSEWMWGFDHSTETQTTYASFFSHISNLAPGYASSYAPRLIDARLYHSISDSDERKSLFAGPEGPSEDQEEIAETSGAKNPYANLKFGDDGNWTMDYVYMRAAEMVLIEAEALAHQGNESEAATVLGELMEHRDPEWNEDAVTVDDIFLQRKIELWGEGFEYFDLKRLGKGINRNYEGTNHRVPIEVSADSEKWRYEIPDGEIQENDMISMEDR